MLKGNLTTGFNYYSLPNIDWMLRILIWCDPSKKEEILNKQLEEKKNQRDEFL